MGTARPRRFDTFEKSENISSFLGPLISTAMISHLFCCIDIVPPSVYSSRVGPLLLVPVFPPLDTLT